MQEKRRYAICLTALLLLALCFVFHPAVASARESVGPLTHLTANGANDTDSVEYWLRNLYNHYWQFSAAGIQYYLDNCVYRGDVYLSSVFPNYEYQHGAAAGQPAWWSWHQKYLNLSNRYDADTQLYWSLMQYALGQPETTRDIFQLNDYVVGLHCGNITDPPSAGKKVYAYKYHDLNANGIWDSGEPPLAGWEIRLLMWNGKSWQELLCDTTDSTGRVDFDLGAFGGLITYPKTFMLEEINYDTAVWTNSQSPDAFSMGLKDIQKDFYFGNYKKGRIEGRKYEDLDLDHVWDGNEPWLNGWLVTLYRNGKWVSHMGTRTDSAGIPGYFAFEGLLPGTYTVTETMLDGWHVSEPDVNSYNVTIGSGETEYRRFGNWGDGRVWGRKFEDLDGDHVHEAGEPHLEGWKIVLTSRSDGSQRPAWTDADGYYHFDGLMPGEYYLEEVMTSDQKEGWSQTFPLPDANGYRRHYFVIDSSGQVVSDQDFGNKRIIEQKIIGRKYSDLDGDGNRDEGEPYLAGWTITLRNSDGTYVASRVTDSDGYYAFLRLAMGSYTLEETLLGIDWRRTQPDPALWPGPYPVQLAENETATVMFGNHRELSCSISGRKFEDMDRDRLHEDGEPHLANWRIHLTLPDGTQRYAVTDADGYYEFFGLLPGEYKVSEELDPELALDGWEQTCPDAPQEYAVTGVGGQRYQDRDFGNYQKGRISGYKWEDVNGDRDWDSGELALPGWTVRLTGGSGSLIASTTTDENGFYRFTGLMPGVYTVSEVLSPGWRQTFPAGGVHSIAVVSGTRSVHNDFGNLVPGRLAGCKWQDMDEDGIKDAGDAPLAGWHMLLSCPDGSVQTATTGPDGTYQFSGLMPGTYTVSEELPQGWEQTYPALPGTYTARVISRTALQGFDFGNFKYGEKSGRKWEDVYPDGAHQTTEPYVAGWPVALLVQDPVTRLYSTQAVQNTDAQGRYSFSGLHHGDYLVREASGDGWLQTSPAEEQAGGSLQPGEYFFHVTSGFIETDNDFGNWHYGTFGRTKGYWMTWRNKFTQAQMEGFCDIVERDSSVYGDETVGFGPLTSGNVPEILQTNNNGRDKLNGREIPFAIRLMVAQFTTTWLNVAASYLDAAKPVYLDRVPGAPQLYGTSVLPLGSLLAKTEENILISLASGCSQGWSREQYIIAQTVFALVNEAENNSGAIFRPVSAH